MTKGEKLNLMRNLYESGSSIEAIAEATGYKTDSVNQLLSQAGIVRRRRISDDEQRIVEMRRSGKKLNEISKATGWNPATISKYLCRIGCNKNATWSSKENASELVDESRLVFAEKRQEKIERFFDNGIRYVTVPLEEIFQSS